MIHFLSLILLAALLVGCDAPVGPFPENEVYSLTLARSRSVPAELALRDAAAVTAELFGTPDQPRWPQQLLSDPAPMPLVDLDRLSRAAGAVSSGRDGTHQGLYREHCATCHGVSGSGTGPASLFQNPHPRDFRHGVFKWKSTRRDAKPTREDLRLVLRRGVPGTGMPSFAVLEADPPVAEVVPTGQSDANQSDPPGGDSDLEALVDYVIYLSVRGEVERRLMAAAIDELDYGDAAPPSQLQLAASGSSEGAEVVAEVVRRVVGSWHEADQQQVPVPAWQPLEGAALAASVQRGEEIFHGPIANCVGCHGPAGNGQAILLDYDDWGKEYSTRLGLTPTDRDAMRPFRQAGALKPRPTQPRKLSQGVYRGGGDAETLYRRISCGIAGTPMPGVEVVSEPSGKGLTTAQMWDLIRYLHSLSQS